jgi:hypothetical protein
MSPEAKVDVVEYTTPLEGEVVPTETLASPTSMSLAKRENVRVT